MYDSETVQECLNPTVTIDDAAYYAQTYITDYNLTLSTDEDLTTVKGKILTGSVNKMMGDLIRLKQLTNDVKTVIDDFGLFDGRADYNNKNANRGRFVGYKIQLQSQSDLALKIYSVSVQIDMPCSGLILYLFNSEDTAAIDTIPLNYTKSLSSQTFTVNLNLNDTNGEYYLGYFESDLATGAQSINKVINLSEEPCNSCQGVAVTRQYYLTRRKYMRITPFYVDSTYLDGVSLFNTDQIIDVSTNTWGLNFKASVTCDISDLICRNSGLFYNALSMRYAIDLLSFMLMSTRNNAFVEKIKDGIIFIRDGNSDNRTPGLNKKYEDAISALNIDFSGFNGNCLPCAKNWGVRKRVMG